MGFFGKIGHAIGHGVHELGGLAEKAAPYVGMIPGVGTIAGGAIGGLGALAHGEGLKGALKYGAEGALSGYGGGLLKGTQAGAEAENAGGSFLGNIGHALKTGAGKVGEGLKDTYAPGGKLDLGKVAATAGTAANLVGQSKQRHSAQNYNNAQIDQRNQLMKSILAPQNYNLPPITPNAGGY